MSIHDATIVATAAAYATTSKKVSKVFNNTILAKTIQ